MRLSCLVSLRRSLRTSSARGHGRGPRAAAVAAQSASAPYLARLAATASRRVTLPRPAEPCATWARHRRPPSPRRPAAGRPAEGPLSRCAGASQTSPDRPSAVHAPLARSRILRRCSRFSSSMRSFCASPSTARAPRAWQGNEPSEGAIGRVCGGGAGGTGLDARTPGQACSRCSLAAAASAGAVGALWAQTCARSERLSLPRLTVKGGRRLRVLALVRVHHEGHLAVLLADLLDGGVKAQVELLERVELEGPQDPAPRKRQAWRAAVRPARREWHAAPVPSVHVVCAPVDLVVSVHVLEVREEHLLSAAARHGVR